MAQKITDGHNPDVVQRYSSAALAFLGDCVYELHIRSREVFRHKGNAGNLNSRSKALTNAKTQSAIATAIQSLLSEEELAVYKRGRNYKSPSVPRSCSPGEYRRATGLEALMGYLFILERHDRIEELIDAGIRLIREDTGKEEDVRKEEDG